MKNTITFTIVFTIIISLTSCSAVNKLFTRHKTVIDSTAVTHERKDSTATKDSIAVHKSESDNTEEIVIDFTGDSVVVTGKTNPDDYFSFNQKTGEIRASKVPVKLTIRRRGRANTFDSITEHSEIVESEVKDDSTHLKSLQKETVSKVHRTSRLWLLLLLLIPIVVYRKQIWRWILNLVNPIKIFPPM
jgi:hypothetical protein